jgi:hypothetical protein
MPLRPDGVIPVRRNGAVKALGIFNPAAGKATRALGESIAYQKDAACLDELARQRLLHSGDLAECIAQVPSREL